MSLVQLAKVSGVPLRTLEGIEKREACMVFNALKIAEALDVTMDELCR
ncbi:helix-turn-helix domain-containing protein [Bacillus chungangensis]